MHLNVVEVTLSSLPLRVEVWESVRMLWSAGASTPIVSSNGTCTQPTLFHRPAETRDWDVGASWGILGDGGGRRTRALNAYETEDRIETARRFVSCGDIVALLTC